MRYIRLITVLVLVACGDGGSTPTSPPTPPPTPVATSITLSATSLSFASLGETSQLTATVKDQNSATMSGALVTWSSSSASVATVSSTGLVTSVANGSATITATSGSASANASASIQQVAVSITLSPDSLVFAATGDTVTVTATVLDAGGSDIPSPSLTWSSSDAGTVTVSSSGVVTAVASGPATVTAEIDDLQAEISARVKGSYLTVTVTGDGDPLPDVSVWLTDPTGESIKQVTDSVGKVLFRSLQAGEHTVTLLQLPTGMTLTVTSPQSIQVAEDQGHDVVFTGIFAQAQVTGTAKSWGTPVEGAMVRIEGKDTVEVTTNSTGVFQVDSVRRGDYTLTISNHTGVKFKEDTITRMLQSGENTLEFVGKPDPEPFFSSVAVGQSGACGLTSEGVAYCWGRNQYGQLGDGTTTMRLWPTPVSGGLTFVSIRRNWSSTCGVTTAGEAYCWGNDDPEPTLISGGHTWTSVTMGQNHTCGVTTAGEAYCWGWNSHGELGDGTTTNRLVPTLVSGGHTWISVTSGTGETGVSGYSCALTETGLPESEAYCWGFNKEGQVGDSTTTDRFTPTPVSGGLTFASLSTNSGHAVATCGLTSEGVAYCWGSNVWKVLGHGIQTMHTTPVPVDGGHKWTSMSVAGMHSCGVTTSGDGYCWGSTASGRLGTGYGCGFCGTEPMPQLVSGGLIFSSISTYFTNTCAVTVAGEAYCWGPPADNWWTTPNEGLLGIGPDLTQLNGGRYALVPLKVGGNW